MFYVVGTPIGNLEDITFRAIRILKEVDYIFAEDTRVTKRLLDHYEIEKRVYQYHEHNKLHQIENILSLLEDDKNIALVTDAGTPCISDPGFELVNEILKRDMKVAGIPGASSIVTGASISGLDMRRMAYEGFLPKKKGRQTLFNKLQSEERTIVILESPNRILKTLKDIREYLGERYVVITRELTKIYEEIIRGDVSEIIEKLEKKPIKGEIVLFIRAKDDDGIYLKNKKGEEDKILVISVEPAYDRVIKSYDNNVYLRQFDKTEKLNHEQITQLEYDRGQRYFEDEVVEDSSIEDIDLELVESYRKNMNLTNSNLEDILKARNFIKKGLLTNACVLLFAKEPTKYLPQARLKFIRYDGVKANVGTEINIIKEKTFDKAIPKIITEVKEFIKTQLREFQYLDGEEGNFKSMPEYPEFAWFEGIVNALTHRNYSIRGEYIRFIMFDDRIEIHSPGKLPNIVTIENILTQRYSRNPRIARILSEFGWVKEMNEGVKRIYSEMEKFFLRKPVYSEPGNNVLLVLENNILNRNIRLEDNLKKIINEAMYKDLNFIEKEIIKFSFMNKQVTVADLSKNINRGVLTVRKYLKKLLKLGILEWHGTSPKDPTQFYSLKNKK